MQKILYRYKIWVYVFVLLIGFLFGHSYYQSENYIFIPFTDLFSLLINIILAVIVTTFISRSLNNHSKILDLKIEGITRFEKNLSKASEYVKPRLDKSFSPKEYETAIAIFGNASEVFGIILEFDLNINQNNIRQEIYKLFKMYLSLITDKIATKNHNGFTSPEKNTIRDLKQLIDSSIYRFKIELFK